MTICINNIVCKHTNEMHVLNNPVRSHANEKLTYKIMMLYLISSTCNNKWLLLNIVHILIISFKQIKWETFHYMSAYQRETIEPCQQLCNLAVLMHLQWSLSTTKKRNSSNTYRCLAPLHAVTKFSPPHSHPPLGPRCAAAPPTLVPRGGGAWGGLGHRRPAGGV